jgi:predicted GNAT superfamily acetyltransferase
MKDLEKTVTARGRKFLLRVEGSHEAEAYQKYEDLRDEIWGFLDDHLAGTRNLMCENFLAEGASLFIGAFREAAAGGFPADAEHLVGFSYGFAGVADKNIGFRDVANVRFYSQFTGVKPGYHNYGLGVFIKKFQKDVVLGRLGIRNVICTYDPLTGVNAHRNVHLFHMDVLEYRVATYGEYGGLLNRADVPTDRFLMNWDLLETRPGADISGREAERALRIEHRRVHGRTGEHVFEVVSGVDLEPASDLVLVPIPADFYRMLRETDVDDPEVRRIPVDWRLQTRRVFVALFDLGYRVADFFKQAEGPAGSYYLLVKD